MGGSRLSWAEDQLPETEAPAEESPAEEVEEAAPRDEVREELLARLSEILGDGAILGSHIARGDITVRVAPDRWHDAVAACHERLRFDYFCFLSGIDWLKSKEAASRYEQVWSPEEEDDADAEWGTFDSGTAGGETRFQVFARLYSIRDRHGITLKADLDSESPSIQSVVDIYRGADWHEREAWEMFGFEFPGHPGLRHLYLPQGFEGHPLRKDFPLLSRAVKPWPGLVDKEPIPGEGDDEEGGDT